MKKSKEPANAIVDVNNLSVRFDAVTVIDAVSFSVARGEFVGLIGPNGAGKSTLIKALLGLVSADSGTYHFSSDLRVGYVPQHYIFSSHVPVSVVEVVRMGSRAHVSRKVVLAILTQVGLSHEMAHKNFHTLSGGQKQRVMIARALVARPDVIFFDEPLSGIDFQTKMQIYDLLKKLNKEGMTIFFVSHDVEHVIDVCDRILCLDGVLHKGCHPMDFAHGARTKEGEMSKIESKCLVEDDGKPCTAKGSVLHHH